MSKSAAKQISLFSPQEAYTVFLRGFVSTIIQGLFYQFLLEIVEER